MSAAPREAGSRDARPLRVGIVGLGSIGLRMLGAIRRHERFECVAAFDPDAAACRRAASAAPGLPLVNDARRVLTSPDADLVYIACPPLFHREHAEAAIDAGRPVLCEKPLGVDLAQSRALVERVQASGLPNAVNLVYASARNAVTLAEAVAAGALGAITWVQIDLHLNAWAARRLGEAPWLAGREQGGFVREVVTHYVFLCQRLLGETRVESAHLDFRGGRRGGGDSPAGGTRDGPIRGGAERFVDVRLTAGSVPVCINGTTEGAGPEVNHVVFWGEKASYRIRDLHLLDVATGAGWEPAYAAPDNPEHDTYRRQLDNVAAMLAGGAHTMPSFAEALRTQEAVEAIVRG